MLPYHPLLDAANVLLELTLALLVLVLANAVLRVDILLSVARANAYHVNQELLRVQAHRSAHLVRLERPPVPRTRPSVHLVHLEHMVLW
jgi:hypothetical protein